MAVAASLVALMVYAISTRSMSVVFEAPSDFGGVQVLERGDGLRVLTTLEGRAWQSAIYPGRPLHLEFPYTQVGMVGLALIPADARILFVGLGGGAMPMYVRQLLREARIDVVEIDPLVVEVAQDWFGFAPDSQLTVHTGDGRRFIQESRPATWDLIVLDAFSDDEVPYALTTREFLQVVRSRLSRSGVVVSNLWSDNRLYPAMVATYVAVFDEVHMVRVPRRDQRILVTGPGTRGLDGEALANRARELARDRELGFDLPTLVEKGYEVAPAPAAPVLEDPSAGPPVRQRPPSPL